MNSHVLLHELFAACAGGLAIYAVDVTIPIERTFKKALQGGLLLVTLVLMARLAGY